MPIIAALTFLSFVIMFLLVSIQNDDLSSLIQSKYFPLVELSRDIETNLASIQRGMQDAVATADSLAISETDAIRDKLLIMIGERSDKYPLEQERLEYIGNQLDDYYRFARAITLRMITEETNERLVEDLTTMTDQYNRIRETVQENRQRYHAEIVQAFTEERFNFKKLMFMIGSATIISILLLGWISLRLTRSITSPLEEVISVANKVAAGDFDVEVQVRSRTTTDEIGILQNAFKKMVREIEHLIQLKDAALREIQKHQDRLEELVSWRTAELESANRLLQREIDVRMKIEAEQKQLVRELEEVNSELRDFAYIVSHDLKAPLRGISSLSGWLLQDYEENLDEKGRELLGLLDSRVKRMHKFIDGVLQYSRVGRIREEIVTIDLNQSIRDVIDLIAPPENIKIAIVDELPTIRIEKTRFEQVFQNLLSNAVKYMDKTEGVISIGCTADDTLWKFSVTDNGPGIDKKHFQRIFKIFQTLQARDEYESTGIGLTLVKKIVEMYGGTIWVESQVGEGSTFIFTLPMEFTQSKQVENDHEE